MKTEDLIELTLKGLLATVTEKVNVLGLDDAKGDLEAIRKVYEDLVLFWELDEGWIDKFDELMKFQQ